MSLSVLADLSEVVAKAGQSLVAVHGRERVPSTGIYWQQGIIITAEHTLKRDDDLQVTLPDGKSVGVTLVGRDAGTDIALLRAEDLALPLLPRRESAVKPGHFILALGLSPEDGVGVSAGILSAVGGEWRTWRGGQVEQFLRPDVELYPGFSGGALVDVEGHVIGMNTSALSRNMNLTLPGATVDRVVSDILEKGRVTRGYLGVSMHPIALPERLCKALELEQPTGVIVLSVEEGSPADQSGVVLGDILVAIGGKPVRETEDVLVLLGANAVGTELDTRVVRGGAPIELRLRVGERPRR